MAAAWIGVGVSTSILASACRDEAWSWKSRKLVKSVPFVGLFFSTTGTKRRRHLKEVNAADVC